jgi:hypothetical protein
MIPGRKAAFRAGFWRYPEITEMDPPADFRLA